MTALVSDANGNRGARGGAVTIVKAEATAPSEPISSERLVYAAGGAGAGLVLAMVLGWFMWTRLARGFDKHEEQTRLAALLDDARWENPSEAARKA